MPNPELPASVITIARVLRLLAFGASVSATVTMAISRETAIISYSNIQIKADYKDHMFFKAFLGVNIAASVYGLFVASLPAKSLLWRFVVVLDVIMCALLASIDSVAMAAAYLHKNGDSQAHWSAICGQFPTYCNRVMGAIAAGFTGVLIYLLIIIYSMSVILNSLLVQ